MEDTGYTALALQETSRDNELIISGQDGKWSERKGCKREHRTHQSHTSPDPWLSQNKFGKRQ